MSITNQYLELYGTLAVAGVVSLGAGDTGIDLNGGNLVIGSLQSDGDAIRGYGTLTSPNVIVNSGAISGSGLTVSVGGLQNQGALQAVSGSLTVHVTGGAGSDNRQTGILTGGDYEAESGGTLDLDLGGLITTDAANILLSGSESPNGTPDLIESQDPTTGATIPLQDTLQTIAASGALVVEGTTYASSRTLTVAGSLDLRSNAQVSSPGLDVVAGGSITGNGMISGSIVDDGIITSQISSPLVLDGPVSGPGLLVIGPAQEPEPNDGSTPVLVSTLELGSATSAEVEFASAGGILVLDDPQDFSGSIAPVASEYIASSLPPPDLDDTVVLRGVTLGTVTGESYVGNTSGGTLTIQEGSTSQALRFVGDFTTASFAISGASVTSGLRLDIVVTPVATPTVGLSVNGSMVSAAIIDTPTPTVTGSASAGITVSLAADGVFEGATSLSGTTTYGLALSSTLAI